MTEPAPARPPQVTMAGWVTILGSAAVVLTVFDLIANLRSIDTRERVQKAISEPPLDGMGIDTAAGAVGHARAGDGRGRLCHRRRDPRVARAASQQAGTAVALGARGTAVPRGPGHRRLPVVDGRRGRGDAVDPPGPRLVRRTRHRSAVPDRTGSAPTGRTPSGPARTRRPRRPRPRRTRASAARAARPARQPEPAEPASTGRTSRAPRSTARGTRPAGRLPSSGAHRTRCPVRHRPAQARSSRPA